MLPAFLFFGIFCLVFGKFLMWYKSLPVSEGVVKVAEKISKGEYKSNPFDSGECIISDRVTVYYNFNEHGQSVTLSIDNERIPLNFKEDSLLYDAYRQIKRIKNDELKRKVEKLKSELDV